MNNDIFQKVFDTLYEVLPTEWTKLILYAGYTTGSYSMKFYTANSQGTYTDCFSQEGVNRTKLIKTFMAIDKILSPERKEMDDKNKWNVMTMIVSGDGTFKVEYDYTDISENAITYEQGWKTKYLK